VLSAFLVVISMGAFQDIFGVRRASRYLAFFGECQDMAVDGIGGIMVLALIGNT